MNTNLLIVFTRNPELGKVKSRLAKTIGKKKALKIYEYLLNHTEKTIRNLNCTKAIYYSVTVRNNDIWDNTHYQKYKQVGDTLGDRMRNAFQDGFKANYNKIVIIGSDLFDLERRHLEQAFDELDNNDIVIGPAQDGGYYLLGMSSFYPNIFDNKEWGTSTVFEDTLKDLLSESVFLLDELNDIDNYDDIKDNIILKALIE